MQVGWQPANKKVLPRTRLQRHLTWSNFQSKPFRDLPKYHTNTLFHQSRCSRVGGIYLPSLEITRFHISRFQVSRIQIITISDFSGRSFNFFEMILFGSKNESVKNLRNNDVQLSHAYALPKITFKHSELIFAIGNFTVIFIYLSVFEQPFLVLFLYSFFKFLIK